MRLGRLNSILILLFLSFLAKGQVSGYIYDSVTKQPLESCNVFDELSKNGTITDQTGKFTIYSTIGSTLSISFIGYKTKKHIIKKNQIKEIYLHPLSKRIQEVVIVMKEDPAVSIMQKVIKNNKEAHQDKVLPNRKELLKIYLTDQKNSFNPLNKSILFQQYSDSLKKGVPFYISIHKYKDHDLIEESSSGVGINKEYFKDYINSIDIDFDIQKNKVNIFGRSIISPVATDAFSYYNYYLHDSSFVNNEYCYKIKIVSKNKNNITFNGILWINTSSFQIQKAEVYLQSKFINFVKDLTLFQEFNNKGPERCQIRNYMQFFLSLSDLYVSDSLSILVEKDISWRTNTKILSDISVTDSLLQKEVAIIQLLNHDDHIKLVTKLSEMFITSYFTIKMIDIGPIYQMHSNNKFEGQRVSFMARTNKNFLTNTLISGYIGWGFKDTRNKYEVQVKIRNKEENSFQLGFSTKSDVEFLGSSFINNSLYPNNFSNSSENIFSSLFKRSDKDEMTYFDKKQISLTKESNELTLTIFYNQKSVEKNASLLMNNNLHQSTVGIKMRYSRNKKVKNYFDIINVKSQLPIFFGALYFTENRSSEKTAFNAKFATLHTINTSIFGRTKYLLDIGIIENNDYSSLSNVELHRGNHSYIYDFTKSSLMNKYEFISDRYVALYIEQHINGRVLNKIPILKKMELREIFVSNIIFGNVHDKSNLDNLPNFTIPLSYHTPYVEVGIGLENIFKALRVNAIWRFSHLENKNITPFGVFGSVYFSL